MENVTVEKRDKEVPAGLVSEYRFILGEVHHVVVHERKGK